MKKHITLKRFALTLLLPLLSSLSFAQYDMTMYTMKGVPQTNLYNPAFIPSSSMHFGIPGLSSVYGGIGTSGARYNQVLLKQDNDSLRFSPSSLFDNTKKVNNISAHATVQWLNFGMKWRGDWYFSASVSDVADLNVGYSKDLINLGVNGNGNFIGETMELGKTSVKALHYREVALGAAYDFNDQWNFGAKLKFLFGKSAVVSKSIAAKLTTTDNNYFLTNDLNIIMNTSVPDTWLGREEDPNSGGYWFHAGNYGMAMDLGATYKMDEQFSFSASVIDLGYISYTKDVTTYTSQTPTWNFSGIDFLSFRGEDGDVVDDKLQHIGDSLVDKFDLTESYSKFTTMLSAKVYLAGTYKLSSNQDVSAVMRNEFIDGKWRLGFTGAYQHKFNKYVSVIGSYTLAERGYGNFGLGVIANYDPVQVYFTTDNFVGVFVPDAMRYSNFHLGVNILMSNNKGRSLLD